MEQIKLVIWDLDETFWKGTLSEGEVTPIEENVNTIVRLTERGIINSIASKNDSENAMQTLSEIQVGGGHISDFFVFPIINWQPKGANVKQIIEKCQLRAPNVLFLDDNPSNLKEVEFYNPGINVMHIDVFRKKDIWSMPQFKGKDDTKLTRLNQYKLLEKKDVVREQYSDNESFLRESSIEIIIYNQLESIKARVLELINRTNQLNFTKVRLDEAQLDSLLADKNIECGAIEVHDKFGDYGICGFYAYEKNTNKLQHYLFSCRILNLGVEEFIWQRLGKPTLEIVEPVSSLLLKEERNVDWIKVVEKCIAQQDKASKKTRILLIGGCDLNQMCHYIDTSKYEVITDFNYVNKHNFDVHREHLTLINNRKNLKKHIEEICRLPFCEREMFDYHLFNDKYDVVVFSVLMDYTQNLFRHKEEGFVISFGGYADIFKQESLRGFNSDEFQYFKSHYSDLGQESPDQFKKQLERFIVEVKSKKIIFINGAETQQIGGFFEQEDTRQRIMNAALDCFVRENSERCSILDMRPLLKCRENFKDNIRHYQRPVYVSMAERLMGLIENKNVKVSPLKIKMVELKKFLNRLRRWIKRKIEK